MTVLTQFQKISQVNRDGRARGRSLRLKRIVVLGIGFLITAAMSGVTANAQEPGAQEPGAQENQGNDAGIPVLEEIIVTTRRRSENLQKVPVAVTAFSADTIEQKDIVSPSDIATRTPGFTFSPFAPGQAVFSFRGISSNDDGAGTENSIAVFQDGVYSGRISNAAFDFFDVERVEVLRGPQGTLYGKNAIGGVINIVTKNPSLDESEAKFRASVGRFRGQKYDGYVTGPIVADKLAAKVAFQVRNRNGFVTNILTGDKLKNENTQGVRGQLLYHGETTDALFSIHTQNERNADMGRMPLPAAPVFPFFVGAGGSKKKRIATTPQQGFSRRKDDGGSLKITQDLGQGGRVTAISSYRTTSARWEMDSVGIPQANVVDDIRDMTDAFTQEIRWSRDLGETIDFILGGFYLNEKTDRAEFFRFVDFFGALTGVDDRLPNRPPNDGVDAVGGYRQINETNSLSAFFHGNWRFRPRLTLSAGVRLTYDKKKIRSSGAAVSGNDPTAPNLNGFIINQTFGDVNTGEGIRAKNSWTNVSPKVSVNWQATEDVMLYFSFSRGFKSGGFGAAPKDAIAATKIEVDPEKASNFEWGFKGDLLHKTVRLNIVGFHTDYNNLQFQRFGPALIANPAAPLGFSPDPTSFGFFKTINAGNAKLNGVETEITWVPLEGLTISGNYAYLRAKGNFNFREYFSTDPGRDFIVRRTLNRAPKNKGSINVDYVHDIGNLGRLRFSADWRYTSTQRADVVDDDTIQEKFNVSDASIAWISPDDTWQLTVWGQNIFDERYFAHVYIIGPGQIGTLGDPAFYGVSVTWRYN